MRRLLIAVSLLVASRASAQDLAKSSNAFGLELYSRLAAQPGNLVFSPASIAMALTMTWAGAKGETAAQMGKTLRLAGAPGKVMAAARKLAAALQDPRRPVKLRIANRLFGERSYRFEPAYLRAAGLEALDFKQAADEARAHINGWVEERTEKRIADLLPSGAVDSNTRLVLVNALYFLGNWDDPFAKEGTSTGRFFVSKDAPPKDFTIMYKTSTFRIADGGDVRALELPYQGGQTSMLIVLPRAIDGLAAFDVRRLDALVAKLRPTNATIGVPKLRLEPAEPLSLDDALRSLGIVLAFDRDRADFTAIANPPIPAERLALTKVYHKAFVRIDEEGTEASAATEVGIGAGGVDPLRQEFIIDHPFLFLVRDNASGLILFMGRVVEP